ncbi:MAG: fatty acid desaturase family protein [Opitutales bacterium]
MHDPKFWSEKLLPYTRTSDWIATRQVLLTLVPVALLWWAYASLVGRSLWFVLPFTVVISLFLLRAFVLMHDCGHYSLFKKRRANQSVGFILGVITGMPQYVWSKNHNYHHKTNGDWDRYGGVFNIITTDEYAGLSERQKKNYWLFRQPIILIPAGFFYVLFFPRINWLLGHFVMAYKILRPLLALRPADSIDAARNWETKYWKTKKDYLHMTYNNLALVLIWISMSAWIGALPFFLLYITSTSLCGSMGILAFTIQHNFENSYASDTARVNYCQAALEGTSMLVLPKVLNWFTADIAYHHLHHLSVAIPNYHLAACHKKYSELFEGVTRIHLSDFMSTFDYQLWDPKLEKVVSREYANGLKAT